MRQEKIRVLVIDDSPFVRESLTFGLNSDPDIEVVATASDPYSARDKIIAHNPHVLTLDVNMPKMNGLEFLTKLMPQYPVPTIMVSAFTEKGARITLDALAAGAVDFVAKPRSGQEGGLEGMLAELRSKIKMASRVNVSHWKSRHPEHSKPESSPAAIATINQKIIAIGASTGGTEAIRQVLSQLPGISPGVVVVQHMPEKFTFTFARRLDSLCGLSVKEAKAGDRIEPGKVLIAPGDRHMEVVVRGGQYVAKLSNGAPESGHRPSVDVLMRSVAKAAGQNARGVLLTGMGSDGAKGLLEMKQAGAKTFAQDEESCVVFGMPKRAWELGAVDRILTLELIAGEVIRSFS